MADMIWDGREAPALASPSSQEKSLIRHFAGQRTRLEAFRHDVATWGVRIADDLDATLPAVQSLFGSWNASLEQAMIENIEGFEPWTPTSVQPRILARSTRRLPQMVGLIDASFGRPSLVSEVGSIPLAPDNRRTLLDFLCRMFWEEVRLVRTSELAPSAVEAFNAIHSQEPSDKFLSNFGNDAQSFLRKNSHLLENIRAKDYGGKWARYVVYVEPDVKEAFRRKLDGEPYTGTFDLEDFGIVIASAYVDDFLIYRREHGLKKLRNSVNEFKRIISGRSVFINPGIDLEPPTQLESQTFFDILQGRLDDSRTDLEKIIKGVTPAPEPREQDSIDDCLKYIDDYAESNPGKPVSGLIRRLILARPSTPSLDSSPSRSDVELPNVAPELWPGGRGNPETPPDFVRRVYGEWLGNGFTRATLRRLDPPLAQAMTNWLRHNEMPADVDLPTLKEQNSRWVERLEKEGLSALLPNDSPEAALREGRRLATLKHRRAARDSPM